MLLARENRRSEVGDGRSAPGPAPRGPAAWNRTGLTTCSRTSRTRGGSDRMTRRAACTGCVKNRAGCGCSGTTTRTPRRSPEAAGGPASGRRECESTSSGDVLSSWSASDGLDRQGTQPVRTGIPRTRDFGCPGRGGAVRAGRGAVRVLSGTAAVVSGTRKRRDRDWQNSGLSIARGTTRMAGHGETASVAARGAQRRGVRGLLAMAQGTIRSDLPAVGSERGTAR